MRALSRSELVPPVLKGYSYLENTWKDFHHKPEIRECLVEMQGNKCAYCERTIPGVLDKKRKGEAQHIEHFKRVELDRKLTFEWTNLFLSCSDQNSCGKYKDHQEKGVLIESVVKPDVDDPEDFLQFLSDGSVIVRPGLSPSENKKGEKTLEIFNLNGKENTLRARRAQAIRNHQPVQELLIGLLTEGVCTAEAKEVGLQLLAEELSKIEGVAHFTAIKHSLISNL